MMTKQEMINFKLPNPYKPSPELIEDQGLDLIPNVLDFRLAGKTRRHYEIFNLLIRIERLRYAYPEEDAINSLVEEYNKLVSRL